MAQDDKDKKLREFKTAPPEEPSESSSIGAKLAPPPEPELSTKDLKSRK